ncbi:Na+/H+ antiporter NhaC [Paenibacillus tyrfis]|uniref:Na+/H+ antiporter NhaC n=1 Tax=Paenibacillus tyrfis TaxID=1501230 RepID=UPI002490C832|nr:Na+/H+ antiporter NhaC [Paenibacillus tyrfis]GLI06438.1 Na+/H+ antiporter NhaC [Paenibacillus tyrfis]
MVTKKPSFFMSSALIAVIVIILAISILHYQVAPQIPILMASILLSLYGFKLGFTWKQLESAIVKGILYGLPSILILCLIGILIGIWVLNGTVPTLSYYGLHILSPSYFLVSAVLICGVVSVLTGSSWSAIGTMGVALMGVAYGMGISPAMAAGAIVCGSVFGDKISPLSDTTNLASATAKVPIFDHIRHMLWTTIPSLILTLILFALFAISSDRAADTAGIETMIRTLNERFTITPLTLLSPLAIIVLAFKRFDAIPTLVVGLLVAIATAFFTVPGVSAGRLMTVAHFGYKSETGVEAIDKLLSLGGLSSMMSAVSLIIMALAFGGLVKEIGLVHTMIDRIKSLLNNKGNVISATVFSSIGVNVIIGECYLSIILPGQMLESSYKRLKLHPKNLSRTLEDAGTIVHPVVPWGVSGAFIMATLNIGMEYVLYSFMCFITPLLAIVFGYTGFAIAPIGEEDERGAYEEKFEIGMNNSGL